MKDTTMKTLFLNPPSFHRFDCAGARYQARRRTRAMWFPVWLCEAASIIDESRVLDCPVEDISMERMANIAKDYNLVVISTSSATIKMNVKAAEYLKNKQDCKIIFVGPHVSMTAEEIMKTSDVIDGVARREYDFTIKEISEGKKFDEILGLTWRKDGKIIHNPDRPLIKDLDQFPYVSKIYKRDLKIKLYREPELLYPYVSIMTGRGCMFMCTFCLWPQTFFSREYRVRSPEHVAGEVKYIKEELPEVEEIMFDDGTFTAYPDRVDEICGLIKNMDMTWSCNARADVRYETLKKMKEAGCRLLVVGYESADQQILNNIHKGVTEKQMIEFTKNCKKLGIMVHGCFVIGLPGETRETIKKSLKFATDLDLDSVQASVVTPYPGTEIYQYFKEKNLLVNGDLADEEGFQDCIINMPDLPAKQIIKAADDFHVKFFYRPWFFLKMFKMILKDKREFSRILNSGSQFQSYVIKSFYKKFNNK
jgi:hopanoid biosynthesis associated radical SAM protein HpnJ